MILGILAVVALGGLTIYWRGRNAVWGGMTIGAPLEIIAAALYYFLGAGFHWQIIGKWIVVCTIIGFTIELLFRIFRRSN